MNDPMSAIRIPFTTQILTGVARIEIRSVRTIFITLEILETNIEKLIVSGIIVATRLTGDIDRPSRTADPEASDVAGEFGFGEPFGSGW
ncbi:hypothetical protein AB0L57_03415 [Nocardia sp. NPDC052254]|uniref:hypothetical protein n=1 Tax=Nocardia sp. NPDC052254 TaxID=3155681 RepID=UPI003434AF85